MGIRGFSDLRADFSRTASFPRRICSAKVGEGFQHRYEDPRWRPRRYPSQALGIAQGAMDGNREIRRQGGANSSDGTTGQFQNTQFQRWQTWMPKSKRPPAGTMQQPSKEDQKLPFSSVIPPGPSSLQRKPQWK